MGGLKMLCFCAESSHDGISVRIPKANFLVIFFCVQLQVRPTWQKIVPLCWVSVETLPGADSRGEIKLWVWVWTYLCGHSFSFSHHLLCSIGLVSKYLGTRSLARLGATSEQSLPQPCEFRSRFIVFSQFFYHFEALWSRPWSLFKAPGLLLVSRKITLMFFVCLFFFFFFFFSF